MGELFRRLRYLLNQRRFDRELESDMQFHREMTSRAGGNFGNVLRLREDARDAWGWTWIDRLGQDLRYGVRVMARSPGFTLVAVLVLAIGIGVNVAAFSVFNMVALKPLPVLDPSSLVRLERKAPHAYTDVMAYPSFLFYREHARTLSAAMAVLGVPPMQIDSDLEGASTSFVTPNYFKELGARPAYGRMLDPAIDSGAGAPPVIVISYGLWQRRFGSDPNVVGRAIRLNGKPAAIVGVLPYKFASLGGQGPDIWLPIDQQPYLFGASHTLSDFTDSSVKMWGRLAPGVNAKAAEQELRVLTKELRRQHPEAVWGDDEFIQSSPGGHLQVMQPEMYQVAAMNGVLTVLILAVACGSLGALLLARAVQREREMGIRLAIGASRTRIFRQLCTESLLLAAIGAVVGLASGCAVIRVVLIEFDAPKWLSAAPDMRVVLFTIAASVLSAVFFGLTPALQIARQGRTKTTARQILVAAQVAGSCVLLIVSGLLVRAALYALYTNPGFGYERVISIDAQLGRHGYSAAQARTYLDQMQERLRAVPGVRSTALVLLPPLGHVVDRETREVDGRKLMVYPNWVSPEFFRTMQIPILLGRTFRPAEKNVVIVSRSFARTEWPAQNPLGKLIGDGKLKDMVVGVVGDAHVNALSDDDAVEQYWPATVDQMTGLVVLARTESSVESLPGIARSISESLDLKLFPEIRQINRLYRNSVFEIARVAGAVSAIGLVALLLACVGVTGLVSFTVWQKTKEIAIRVALGARSANVLRAILGQFSRPIGVGLLVGTGVAAAGSKVLRRALFGVSNLDPVGYVGAILFLGAILVIAALLPALRGLRVNVSKALHYE